MNSSIEAINIGGGQFLHFAGAMLWQSSLLIALVFILDWSLARKLRASVRYALWLAVLVKLLLPPTLALPTSPAWWLHPVKHAAATPPIHHDPVTYDETPVTFAPSTIPIPQPPPVQLTDAGWLLLGTGTVSLALLFWLAIRWWQVSRLVRHGLDQEQLSARLNEAQQQAGFRSCVRLKIVDDRMSPALCGLFRPVILLPHTLTDRLSPSQLRVVLLHELFHLRRRDMWVNFAQTLLQIFYWWHPLLWLANARVRQVREQAVDDAVMLALNDTADDYAPTLLEVARMTFRRPTIHLGLVGIMESRSALRHRIERLVNFSAPRKAGLTFASLGAIFLFSAVALPMGEAPDRDGQSSVNGLSDQPLIASTFAINNPADEPKVEQQLSQSGQLPAHFFYDKNGLFFVRGTINQLNMVERIVAGLNGFPTNHLKSFGSATSLNGSNTGLATNLQTRVFRVSRPEDFSNLLEILKRVAPNRDWSNPSAYSDTDAFLALVNGMGLKLDSSGKALFFNDRSGLLYVKATSSELDVVEKIIQTLINPPIHSPGTKPREIASETYGLKGSSEPKTPATAVKNNATNIYSAVYKVDPAFISEILNQPVVETNANRERSGNSNNMVTEALFAFFKFQGVDLKAPEKQMTYDASGNLLFVDATTSDLRTMDDAGLIRMQLHIKARFYEVPQNFFSSTAAASLPDAATNGVAVLTAAEARSLQHQLNAYNHFKGVEILAEPEVTTTTGRQTSMRSTRVIDVITNSIWEQNPTNHEIISISAETGKIETGPVFDVLPYLLSDGHTLNLFATASKVEFVGYADSTNLANDLFTNSAGETGPLPLILPAVELSRESANRNLYDGQSLVFFPKSEVILFSKPNHERDERVAEHIRKWEQSKGNPILMVVVTANIIDPVGNLFYRDGEFAVSQDQIPKQPPN